MKLSVIVATRNRAHAITCCLDSIAASLAHAASLDAEIVVVDNGSTDATSEIVKRWASACPFPVRGGPVAAEPKVRFRSPSDFHDRNGRFSYIQTRQVIGR